MAIKQYGLIFGTIFLKDIRQWFWSVWDNQPSELWSPPIFSGLANTEDEVKKIADGYGLEVVFEHHPKKFENKYVKIFFEYNKILETKKIPFCTFLKKNSYYFFAKWSSMYSFLIDENPIYYNNKMTQKEYNDYKLKFKDIKIGNSNYAKVYIKKRAALIKQEKPEAINIDDLGIIDFLYSSTIYFGRDEKIWHRYRVIKKTKRYIFVERIPFNDAASSPHNWRKYVIYTAILDRTIFEKEGIIYSRSFEGWFCSYEHMKRNQEGKTWEHDIVIELPENEIEWALKLYALTLPLKVSDVRSAFAKSAKKYHPDIGGKAMDFIKFKEAYDIILKFLENQN